MDETAATEQDACKLDAAAAASHRGKLAAVAEQIIEHCDDDQCFTHIDYEPIPSEGYVAELIAGFREVLFPGFYSREKLDPVNLKYTVGQKVSVLYDLLAEQITHSVRHECFRHALPCSECEEKGHTISLKILESVPQLRQILSTDVRAAYDGDPAAKSYDEIIFSYPGIHAITVYRVAHRLFELGVPLLPRIMTEAAHSATGIDIHPGATIGKRFVIDLQDRPAVSSRQLGTMLTIRKTCEPFGTVELSGVSDNVSYLLRLTRIAGYFGID
jgi:serine O-acetyltransferase